MRRSNKWIGAHIKVKQCALCTFKQDLLPRLNGIVNKNGRICHHRTQTISVCAVFRQNCLDIQRTAAVYARDYTVLACASVTDHRFKPFRVYKIVHTDAAALGFIHICGANAFFSSADRSAVRCLFSFTQCVQFKMPRHNAMGTRINPQLVSHNPLLMQPAELFQDSLGIDYNPSTNDVQTIWIEYAGRNQLELEFYSVCHNGVACIIAALAADDHISL